MGGGRGGSASGRLQGSEGQKVRLRQYTRAIDTALSTTLNGLDVPLILATTQPLESIYRSTNTYGHLAAEVIEGNAEETNNDDLAAHARGILDRLYAEELGALNAPVAELQAQGRAIADLSDISRSATFGAVDTLIFDIGQTIPCFLDETTGAIQFSEADDAHDDGVVDEIARRALLARSTHRGRAGRRCSGRRSGSSHRAFRNLTAKCLSSTRCGVLGRHSQEWIQGISNP